MSVAYILSMEFLQLSQSRSGKDDPNFYDLKVAGLPCGPLVLSWLGRCVGRRIHGYLWVQIYRRMGLKGLKSETAKMILDTHGWWNMS